MGVEIPLCRLEGEDGEGHAPDVGHPVVAGDDRRPHVIEKHQGQGEDAQVGGVEAEFGFIQWDPSLTHIAGGIACISDLVAQLVETVDSRFSAEELPDSAA